MAYYRRGKKKHNKGFRRRGVRCRKAFISRHHLCPKSRGGSMSDSNLLKLWRDRHDMWHDLFGNRTLDEIIAVLVRIKRMKHYDEG